MANPNSAVQRDTMTDAPPKIQVTNGMSDAAMRNPRKHQAANGTVAAVEAGYTSAFAPVALPSSQDRIDRIEDKLSVPIGDANDAYEKLNAFFTANASTISSVGNALASAANLDVKSIENTITKFAETSSVLMKGLDALGQVHPFVGVAVTAFKLVISLDITRRQNNKKVLLVKIQMQDMMSILFQLRHMRDPEETGPDGTTLKDRMSGLMQSIASDITACGSACDVYIKKSFLAKTIKSKIYESRLAGYVTMFDTHKKAVAFALSVHTALGVDQANRKLDGQDAHLKVIEDKMEALFRKLDTPREREVQKFIDEKGGAKACVDNDETLEELVAKSGESLATLDPTRAGSGDLASAKKLLNKELAEDVDDAFKKNMKLFDRKLEMQSKQLADTISLTGEHIISVLSGGAHERILNADLQAIWKEQGWKGSVKARHFVLALNDYYTEKFSAIDIAVAESAANSVAGSAPPSPILSPAPLAVTDSTATQLEDDRWALAYINVAHLQPILEAVDDDGTGFVSIKEANDFALLRPRGWSLLTWVAFWAGGWHATVTWYKNRIYNLLSAMMRLVQRVKPANVNFAGDYFAGPGIRRVELLLRSTRSAASTAYDDARLASITRAFQDMEAERLESQMKGILYELDDVATIRLITGPRRIERFLYPMLYKLLQRHFDILRVACVHILDETEFSKMRTSLATVFKAVDERTKNLEAIFKSNSLDVRDRLGNFAFGMFQLSYSDRKAAPAHNTIHSFEEEDGFGCDDEDLGPDSDDDEKTTKATLARVDTGILTCEIQDEPINVYDFETLHPPPVTLANPLDGKWTGRLLETDGTATEGVVSMVLTRTADKLTGAAENYLGLLAVEGSVEEDHKIVLTLSWPDGFVAECTGQYDTETDTIKGTWEVKEEENSDSESGSDDEDEDGSDDDSSEDGDDDSNSEDDDDDKSSSSDSTSGDSTGSLTFVFRRTPSSAYRFYCTDAEFTSNRARARWNFAIAAAIDEVQRTRMSWSYLKGRFEERKRFIELMKRDNIDTGYLTPWTPLTDSESAELTRLKSALRSCDARFYNTVAEFELQQLVDPDRDCDSCGRSIRDTWLFCIQCMDDRFYDNIDLCPECVEQTPRRNAFVHKRSHLLVKTYRRLHDGDLAWMVPEARVVAERVKKAFRKAHSLLSRIDGTPTAGRHTGKSKSKSKPPQICCCCGEPASPPCWVCIDCDKDTYICKSCDAKRATALPDGVNPEHKLSHPLVQILDSDPNPEPVTTDGRIIELETRMSGLDSKIASLEEKLENRFASLETILHGMGEKLLVKC
ncbi:hypothetical protein GGX14DRAFT_581900 [Mycena pura]|uniref:EF-hand domain-containing protein n=1 Tax=Mycena pura TaxID=153505 RepID=A0AAD6YV88_9AGAR|nr:hypothetical protein GGX14DRAFT_581900 [Mycena pura]